MKPDPTGGCMLLLLFTVHTMSGAVPVLRPLRGPGDTTGCPMAQLRPLSPEERQAFNTAKDVLGEQLLLNDTKCNSDVFFRAWNLRQLQLWERRVALQAELALTLEVLGSVTDPALWEVLKQPIHTLRLTQAQLQACVPSGPKAGHRTYSYRLNRWLKRLKQVTKKESPGCLQTSVISNLFHVLTQDLRCVARPDLCA